MANTNVLVTLKDLNYAGGCGCVAADGSMFGIIYSDVTCRVNIVMLQIVAVIPE